MKQHINVEIKAHSADNGKIRNYLKANATHALGVDQQTDTYFNCHDGRLKLRQGNIENSLIYYRRPDTSGPKKSEVDLVKLAPKNNMRSLLAKSNGIKVVVSKSREIYFIDNVKFHIDTVEGIGEFVEIEAIDSDGTIGLEKLNEQCSFYMQELGIQDDDCINISYSDMILKKAAGFLYIFGKEFDSFMSGLFRQLNELDIEFKKYPIDHICYRVNSAQEYEEFKTKFGYIGDLLIESEVGGRNIATYKLYKPLKYKNYSIELVELPSPKPGKDYKTGLEHAEFVIDQSFEDFAATTSLEFDWKGTHKEINPELRLKLEDNLSVKFHHMPLDEVIEIEQT
jgi:adenylate cyclase class 2